MKHLAGLNIREVLQLGLIMVASFFLQTSAFGQAENQANKTVATIFEKFYNNKAYDSIFSLYSDEMKKALPLEKTTSVLGGVYQQLGAIKTREFSEYQQGYASYKTNFEKGMFLVNISIDGNAKINGLFFKPYSPVKTVVPTRNKTKMFLPFKEEWTVVWGGDTKEQNYHVQYPAQKNAFDIVIKDAKGSSFKTNGRTNEDYYAFGKKLMAPAEGEVVLAVDGIKDNIPGEMNPTFLTGNCVILKTADSQYLFFGHFKQGSVQVKQGQKIKRGHLLGLCGNSGNSSEPHLHFHIQNIENMSGATGIKCYFDSLMVNGEKKSDYSPVQGDKIKTY